MSLGPNEADNGWMAMRAQYRRGDGRATKTDTHIAPERGVRHRQPLCALGVESAADVGRQVGLAVEGGCRSAAAAQRAHEQSVWCESPSRNRVVGCALGGLQPPRASAVFKWCSPCFESKRTAGVPHPSPSPHPGSAHQAHSTHLEERVPDRHIVAVDDYESAGEKTRVVL